MKKYKVSIVGSNFLMEEEGRIQKKGFQAIRYVEALSEGVAEQKALAVINADTGFINQVFNESSNPPFMMVREVEEIEEFPAVSQIKDGYDFVSEEEAIEEEPESPGFFKQLFGSSSWFNTNQNYGLFYQWKPFWCPV